MRALQLNRLEGPAGLELVDLPDLSPDAGLVIDVHTAGVGFADLLFTRGEYQIKPPVPFVPCTEVAGTVRHVPPDVPLQPGQRVVAVTPLGALAEQALAIPALTYPLPEEVGFDEAAALMVNYQTADHALRDRARLKMGETILVHGATGGVGSAAVQIAKLFGARVIGATGSPSKLDTLYNIGCDEAIVATPGFAQQLKELTSGRGVDVVLDPVGGDRFDESLRCLGVFGRLLVIGFTEGRIPQVAVNRILLKSIAVIGVNWGGLALTQPEAFRTSGLRLLTQLARGELEPLIGGRYALAEGRKAFEAIADRSAVGKLLVKVRTE
jgi:NADPH2:quinone reductase